MSSMAALRNTSSGQMSLLSEIKGSKERILFLRDAATSQSGMVKNLLIGATDVFPEPVPRYSFPLENEVSLSSEVSSQLEAKLESS